MSLGCSGDVSIVADPAPATIEATPAPAATIGVSRDSVTAEDVDTSVGDEVASGQKGAAERHDQMYGSIREVDFMNGFTYDIDLDFGSPLVTVSDGSFENGEFNDPEYFWFGITDVDFGDLNGDGTEEAIVATSWNSGGSGYFDRVLAFRLVGGAVEVAGVVPFGDRAEGGIFDVQIADGITSVWSFSTTLGACCPNQITQNTLVLGEHWIAMADRGQTRSWLSFNSYGEDPELTFLSGTSSAMLAIYGFETKGGFRFEAALDQRLTFALVNGPAPADILVTSMATGQVMSGLAEMVLPADGFYEVVITFDKQRNEKTMLDVIIDDGEPEPLVSWVPVTEQVLVSEEPYVTSSLIWPVFTSEEPGTDAANDALERFVTELDDDWIQDVTEFSEPQNNNSSYDVSYEITLATADLVAVRFDYYDYVCCRPYPNYGSVSAVLDLVAARLIPVDEILDMNQINEITRIWITELEKQDILHDTVEALLSQSPHFDSLTLRPEGVEFGTGRNSLGGGTPGTSTVVSYARLGDLVNPALVARVARG
jgi:hypothetical protein